jgi:hypothetical protein
MPIAYSQLPIINGTLRGDTAAHWIADLEPQLIAAGWVLVRSIAGGYVYEITSPDTHHFQARVLVQDDISFHAANPSVDLYNFRSAVIWVLNVAESVHSFQYQVRTDNFWTSFQTVIGRAQMFISVPGNDGQHWSSFACGIPAQPTATGACVLGLTPPSITDIWWANGGAQWGFDWRSQATCYACMTYYLNGVAVIAPDNNTIANDSGYLTLFPLTAFNTLSSGQIPWPTITYSAHSVLNIDALIGWNWTLKGLLWDAFLQTAATTLDQVQTFEDEDKDGNAFNVRCITWHSEFYSSLQLVIEVTGAALGNIAY